MTRRITSLFDIHKNLRVRLGLLALLTALLQACGGTIPIVSQPEQDRGPKPGTVDVSDIKDAVPKDEPRSKYGNPASYVVNGKTYYVMKSSKGFSEQGIASWYGEKFNGRRTSSGETYDMYGMTAAHKTLPLPTYVEIRNLQNGKIIVVKVNDRGPFHENRVIDLSYSAASKLGILGKGTGLVELRTIDSAYQPRGSATPSGPESNEIVKITRIEAPVASVAIPIDSNSKSGFYIQVGAFAQMDNAQKMYDKLAGLRNSQVSISEAMVNGSRVYRVRIGPLDDVSVADGIVSQLGSFGITEHRITTD